MWSLLQTRILRLRLWNLIGSIVLVVFNAAIHVWPMVGLNVVLTVINVWNLRTLVWTRHDQRHYAVVPVGTDDAFLAHTLRVHGPDIARFFPRFRWDADDPAQSAFLIVSGDETVGVVVLRPDPANARVAHVELDYVTPRFRDFTPGEFVYRRSGLLTNRGFATVTSPPGMVGPYYRRLGFRRSGEVFTLDLTAPPDIQAIG